LLNVPEKSAFRLTPFLLIPQFHFDILQNLVISKDYLFNEKRSGSSNRHEP